MINYSDEKRPAFFRKMSPECFFEGEALDIWKGLKEPPKFPELDEKLDAELDKLLEAEFMPKEPRPKKHSRAKRNPPNKI